MRRLAGGCRRVSSWLPCFRPAGCPSVGSSSDVSSQKDCYLHPVPWSQLPASTRNPASYQQLSMTRFVADAIGTRSGRPKGYTKKDLRKNMETFIQTGVHPDVQKAQQKAAADAVTPLPDHDPNRDFVFLELQLGQETLGRLVIELFADIVAVAANHLRQRCLPGSKTGLARVQVHKLQPGFALWLGKNPAASEGLRLQPNSRLRHVDSGTVSISSNGDEVAITLGRALILDRSYQVVGRVHGCQDVLEKLNDVPVNPNDVPLIKLVVCKCGPTNASGSYEELAAGGDGLPDDPAARLAKQSQGARAAVKQALAVGLGQKRQPEGAAGPSNGAARQVKAKMLDTMLGDISDDSDSDDGDDSDQEEGTEQGSGAAPSVKSQESPEVDGQDDPVKE